MRIKRLFMFALVSAFALSAFSTLTMAQEIIVTPDNTQGWSKADTNAGGAVNFIQDFTAPQTNPNSPKLGALQLITNGDTSSRAQYMHAAGIPLAGVNSLSYQTKQNGGPPEAAASYQLPVCLGGVDANGACIGFTTLVYEPYWNGAVVPGAWQYWDVDAGQFWSSRTVTLGACSTVAGAGGPPFYTLATLKATCPSAVVPAFGVNVGTYNTNYNVEVDLVQFNNPIYNFEPYEVARNKDACKNGGFQFLRRADGSPFKNQGDCVSYTNNGK